MGEKKSLWCVLTVRKLARLSLRSPPRVPLPPQDRGARSALWVRCPAAPSKEPAGMGRGSLWPCTQTPLPSETPGCNWVTVAPPVRNNIQKSIPMGIFGKAFSLLLTISCLVFCIVLVCKWRAALTFYSLISHHTLNLMSSLWGGFRCIFLPCFIASSGVRVRHCTEAVLYFRSVVTIRRLYGTNSEKVPSQYCQYCQYSQQKINIRK